MQLNPLNFKIDPASERSVLEALNQFEISVSDRIVRKALREFAEYEMARIAPLNNMLNPKHEAYRIRYWPNGIAWLGVGYRVIPGFAGNDKVVGRARRKMYDAEGEGWRSHFAELGFHSWRKGMPRPEGRAGKGWKRKLRHRGRGVYHRGTKASQLVHQAVGPLVRQFIAREIAFQMQKRTHGKRARRMPIKLEGHL